MQIRDARPDDAQMLAHIHVQAWQETYTGLLPEAEIAKRDLTYRWRLWGKIITQKRTRVAVAPKVGFAQIGPQRDDALRGLGYPVELYSFYVLKSAYGKGVALALLRHVLGNSPAPFSALVLDDNPRACGFYEKIGMRHHDTRDEYIGDFPIRERAYICDHPHHIFHD